MTDDIKKKSKTLKSYAFSSIRFLLQFLFVIFFILIMMFFALYARILWKPIDLAFLHPLFEHIVSDDTFDIKIKNASMIHNYDVGLLGVHVDSVIIHNKQDSQEYTIDDITLDISKTSIFQQELGINSAKINTIKLPEIRFNNNQSSDINLQKILNDFFNTPILSPFKRLKINQIDGSINLPNDNNNTQQIMDINISSLKFKRNHSFLNHQPIYDLRFDFKANDTFITDLKSVSGHFETIYYTQNQAITALLKDFKSNYGNVLLANTHINLDNGYFKINGTTDNIHDGHFYPSSIGLKSLEIHGKFNKQNQSLDVQNYEFAFNDFVSVKGSASADLQNGFDAFAYRLNANIDHLTIPYLLKLWSPKLAIGAREWVVYNLKKSEFGTAVFAIAGKNTDNYPQKISLNAPITDASFSYLSPMIPATNVNGRLMIENKTFTAMVDTGMIDVLSVKNTSFKILDISNPTPTGYIDAHLEGTLKPLLTLIDSKPLNLMSKGGFGYDNSVGQFNAKMTIEIPLLKDVKLSDITLATDVSVKNASLKIGRKQLPIQNINADLHLTPSTADGTGNAHLFGINSTFKWHENFDTRSKITTDLTLNTPTINEQQAEKLVTELSGNAIDIPFYAKGNAQLKTHVQLQNGTIKNMNIQGDISDMYCGYGDTMWHFKSKSPKTIAIIAAQQGAEFHVQKFSVTNKRNIFQLSNMIIDKTGIRSSQIDAINFNNIIRGMSGYYHKKDKRHYTDLNASKFFMQPIIDDQYKNKKIPTKIFKYPNLFMRLKVKKLQKTDLLIIDDADIVASRHTKNPHLLYLDIQASSFDTTQIQILETGIETRKITLQSHNGGRLLKIFGILDNFKGGDLTMDMVQKSGIITGTAVIQKGKIFKSPLMAKLLSLASLSGIVDRLNNRGLSIDKTSVDFRKVDDMIYLKDGIIQGSAIGMSFQGEHDLAKQTVNIYGTLVPFFGLNSVLSEIPIVGQIVSSRTTEGLVGMSYKIQGKTEKPQISVNPLSILTIGILRRIFEE